MTDYDFDLAVRKRFADRMRASLADAIEARREVERAMPVRPRNPLLPPIVPPAPIDFSAPVKLSTAALRAAGIGGA